MALRAARRSGGGLSDIRDHRPACPQAHCEMETWPCRARSRRAGLERRWAGNHLGPPRGGP
eukprot:12078055-Alexandrium_andersonii.AAC.1